MFYIGADVSKKRWLAIRLGEGNNWEVELFQNINELWERYKKARLILLDIPIGLPEEGSERSCDIEARKRLGKRQFSVFPVPCRAAVYAEKEEASDINKQKTGRKLSKQSLGIIPYIKQVDQLLSADMSSRSRIKEVHPELCFWALNHYQPMQYSKSKTEEREQALLEREQLLISVYPFTQDIVDYTLSEYSRKEVGKDDILDALVSSVTALATERGIFSIPEKVEFDSHGLPMEMVYSTSTK